MKHKDAAAILQAYVISQKVKTSATSPFTEAVELAAATVKIRPMWEEEFLEKLFLAGVVQYHKEGKGSRVCPNSEGASKKVLNSIDAGCNLNGCLLSFLRAYVKKSLKALQHHKVKQVDALVTLHRQAICVKHRTLSALLRLGVITKEVYQAKLKSFIEGEIERVINDYKQQNKSVFLLPVSGLQNRP